MSVQEPLREYHKKRDFSRTPEPRGKKSAKVDHGLYVIQKHAASHLHYDFRLELDGVLKSWAVPKGPSFDPDDKRLARHVEDHPIEYGEFEGIIPKGEYGGGTVLLWDRGHWEPEGDPEEGYRRGKLKFHLHGDKLHGGFALVRMRGGSYGRDDDQNWLLIKERDSDAASIDIVTERPESVLSGRTIDEIAADPEARTWHSNRSEAGSEADEKPKKAAASPKKAAASPKKAAASRATMPENIEVQLATLVTEPPTGQRWLYEMKLDGYRLVVFIEHGKARLITRRGQDWTERFAPIAEAALTLPVKSAILDGEIVVLRPDGVSDFQALQNAMQDEKGSSLLYFAFDLLYLDGKDLRPAPLVARKEALREILGKQPAKSQIRLSDHLEVEGSAVFHKACELGVEGVIAKERDAPYHAGRRGSWLKIKCHKRQELVIGGFTEPSGSRSGLGALLVGYHDAGGKLVYAGKVGTGFSAKLLGELRARLDKIEQSGAPFTPALRMRGAHWVKPQLVAEIRFTGWTQGGRLRHPAFMGLREDKDAKSVVREKPNSPPAKGAAKAPRASKARSVAKPTVASKARTAAKAESPAKTVKPRAAGKASSEVKRLRAEAEAAAASIKLSNPDKVLYPELGITKRALVDYYTKVAPYLLPLVAKRPLTLVRCPNGQGKPCFFQKHVSEGLTEDIGRLPIVEDKGEKVCLYIHNAAGLLQLVQLGALEIHTWGSHIETVEQPDLIVFDLDPGPGVPWGETVQGARTVRLLLEALGLKSFVKTTGGKGLHVCLPLRPGFDWDEIRPFVKGVATLLERTDPGRYVSNMAKSKRNGKIFVDYLRNGRGATAISPYSTRARPTGYIAMPLSWDELGSIEPSTFTIETAPEWLEKRGDPWADFPSTDQELTEAMIRKVNA